MNVRITTTIKVREDLKKLVEDAIRNGRLPAGIHDFSAAVEHLIEKELGEPNR